MQLKKLFMSARIIRLIFIVVVAMCAMLLLRVVRRADHAPDGLSDGLSNPNVSSMQFGAFDYWMEPRCGLDADSAPWSTVFAITDQDSPKLFSTALWEQCVGQGSENEKSDFSFLCDESAQAQFSQFEGLQSFPHCTGIRVAPSVVVTPKHCLTEDGANNNDVVRKFSYEEQGPVATGSLEIDVVCERDGLDLVLLKTKITDADYSTIKDIRKLFLVECSTASNGWSYDCVEDKRVIFLGHMLGLPRGVAGASRCEEGSDPDARIKKWCAEKNEDGENKAYIEIDQYKFSSGGGLYVWSNGEWNLFGMVTGSYSLDNLVLDTDCCEIGEIEFNTGENGTTTTEGETDHDCASPVGNDMTFFIELRDYLYNVNLLEQFDANSMDASTGSAAGEVFSCCKRSDLTMTGEAVCPASESES